MKRLIDYFQMARTCNPFDRHAGLEIETLFISKNGKPIRRSTSQRMFLLLVELYGWSIAQNGIRGGTVVHLQKQGNTGLFELIYELGWNNIEMITPPWQLGHLFDAGLKETIALLRELYKAADRFGATPIMKPYDGFKDLDTLIMPDTRDEIWRELDGDVLRVLGHIASVHFSVDLTSVDEGMAWIKRINELRKRAAWPDPDVAGIWDTYLKTSLAGYEMDRYGDTPADDFGRYCGMLSERKVVMNKPNGELVRMDPALPFWQTDNVNIELFLRSVWWGARLRVRNGKLVLEIRDIPRCPDHEIGPAFQRLREDVGF